MKCGRISFRSSAGNALETSCRRISNPLFSPKDPKFAAITSQASLEDSTKWTMSAPRLSASIPTAPVPANRSNQVDPASASGFPAVRRLNSVSRRRSEVGRISSPRSERSGLLRNFPAITRMSANFPAKNSKDSNLNRRNGHAEASFRGAVLPNQRSWTRTYKIKTE